MTFDSDPYIENGTTRVPMRAIFEGLGAAVDYDGATKTVTAQKGDTKIELVIGSDNALVNGKENKLLVPAEIKNSRTMVPLRFVSEALGAQVDWDGDTKTITITSAKEVDESKAGKYSFTAKEEMEGEELEFTYNLTLNADGTGKMQFNDEVPVTWDDNGITTEDGSVYKCEFKGDKLVFYFDDENTIEFEKIKD